MVGYFILSLQLVVGVVLLLCPCQMFVLTHDCRIKLLIRIDCDFMGGSFNISHPALVNIHKVTDYECGYYWFRRWSILPNKLNLLELGTFYSWLIKLVGDGVENISPFVCAL